MNWNKIFCFLGIHDWYYGRFQTGKRSEYTGDHVGVSGRDCSVCDKKQIRVRKKHISVKSFNHKDIKAHIL